MAENTKIQWTDRTFNPWRGCTKVHAGCANCYAEALSGRNPATLGVWGPNGTRVVAAEAAWREPLKWDRAAAKAGERHRVFCASLADVFEDWQGKMDNAQREQLFYDGDGWTNKPGGRTLDLHHVRRRLFALIDATPNLDWLLLTKRPENVRSMWPGGNESFQKFRSNVWLGTSISDQATANKWIPELQKLRELSPVLFLSAEPLVGPIDLSAVECNSEGSGFAVRDWAWCDLAEEQLVDLVIVGGESGHGARPCNVDWIRSIVKQCAEAGVACFVKQLGANAGPFIVLTDPKGGNPDEWPADLRVRQMPKLQTI